MKLTKVIEIMELNIKEAGSKMPPDCLDALQISLAAVKEIQYLHETHVLDEDELLPGETPAN